MHAPAHSSAPVPTGPVGPVPSSARNREEPSGEHPVPGGSLPETRSAGWSVRAWRRFFSGWRAPTAAGEGGGPPRDADFFAVRTANFGVTQGLIRAFYCFNLFLTFTRFPEFIHPGKMPGEALLLWPAVWLAAVPSTVGYIAVFALQTAGSLLGAVFCQWRWVRVVTFLGLLQIIALDNSKVKIGHSMHLLVLVAFLLVFLPARWDRPVFRTRRMTRERTLLIFWACQAVVLLSYTMSGLGKLGGVVYQVVLGQPNVFSRDALALHTAERLAQTESTSLLGAWLLEHPWAGWLPMIGTFYLQLFAFWIAFRPALQRWWAAGLIGFHAGSYFLMTINFPQNCLLLGLLFFRSPFLSSPEPGWRQIGGALPLFGSLFQRLFPVAARRSIYRAADARKGEG